MSKKSSTPEQPGTEPEADLPAEPVSRQPEPTPDQPEAEPAWGETATAFLDVVLSMSDAPEGFATHAQAALATAHAIGIAQGREAYADKLAADLEDAHSGTLRQTGASMPGLEIVEDGLGRRYVATLTFVPEASLGDILRASAAMVAEFREKVWPWAGHHDARLHTVRKPHYFLPLELVIQADRQWHDRAGKIERMLTLDQRVHVLAVRMAGA